MSWWLLRLNSQSKLLRLWEGRRRRKAVPYPSLRSSLKDEALATLFLSIGIWWRAANPLPRCLVFPPTLYSQCALYSWVASGMQMQQFNKSSNHDTNAYTSKTGSKSNIDYIESRSQAVVSSVASGFTAMFIHCFVSLVIWDFVIEGEWHGCRMLARNQWMCSMGCGWYSICWWFLSCNSIRNRSCWCVQLNIVPVFSLLKSRCWKPYSIAQSVWDSSE